MNSTTFAEKFWDLYAKSCRPSIESACVTHLRRTGNKAIDLDDMISWIDCRVWRLVRERPAELLDESLTADEAAERIARASGMLARWAYMALVRSASRRSQRERATEDVEMVMELARSQSTSSRLERNETTAAALNELRSKLGAELRGRIAASWKQPDERTRIAEALDAKRPEDENLLDRVNAGEIRTNTVEQMRSRSLHRSRDIMKSIRRSIALLAVMLSVALITTAPAHAANGGDDDGGEQTGGR
ncbi:MAG: hypothetical protein ACIAQ0_09890 [Phycisphaerales bacterium JB058]